MFVNKKYFKIFQSIFKTLSKFHNNQLPNIINSNKKLDKAVLEMFTGLYVKLLNNKEQSKY